MGGIFKVRITESAGLVLDPRYRFMWSAWLDGILPGTRHAGESDEALSQAQELVDPEDIDDAEIDYRDCSID